MPESPGNSAPSPFPTRPTRGSLANPQLEHSKHPFLLCQKLRELCKVGERPGRSQKHSLSGGRPSGTHTANSQQHFSVGAAFVYGIISAVQVREHLNTSESQGFKRRIHWCKPRPRPNQAKGKQAKNRAEPPCSQTGLTWSSHLGLGSHVPTKLQMNPCQYLQQTGRMVSLGGISCHKLRACPRMSRVRSEKLALRCRVIRRHKIALHPRPQRCSVFKPMHSETHTQHG